MAKDSRGHGSEGGSKALKMAKTDSHIHARAERHQAWDTRAAKLFGPGPARTYNGKASTHLGKMKH